ncbi:hypothetical protein K435DRAFT_798043 [Dendrothele bispora CBS 962.96]|uniref:Uncharacterized protein n=1 Tax=Dendrothele bispora (strain CBS 962.96) TaxID=1314807 RepID=A0A4S8M0L1_DENBC|nr:hypothetical protein K435DRAFT_798043 [Dendrothele bispora CBS 962.96]
MTNETSVLDVPDGLEDSLEQVVVSNTVGGIFYGVLLTMEIVVIYMNLFSLIGLRTLKSSVNQDPVVLGSTLQLLQRLEMAEGVIYPLNYLLSDAVVVWRAWVLVNRKSRIVLGTLFLGTIGKYILHIW